MIDQETIDTIKNTVDLKLLVESKGIKLKKNGKGYFALCPFHHDTNPSLSVTPSKNEWHCFGCDKGGDVIRFVELYDGVNFREAVNRLTGSHDKKKIGRLRPVKQSSSNSDTPNVQQYLERLVTIYENNFIQKDKGKAYLTDRNIVDESLFTYHHVGFCDGTLNDILPQNGSIRDALKEMGILFEDGSERFINSVVFPVYDPDGHVITLYGRHIGPSSNKKHLFLPEKPTGLWNGNIIKTSPEIILTESVIDALSVQMAGFSNVISIQGTNGLTDREIMDLKIYGVQKIILLLEY